MGNKPSHVDKSLLKSKLNINKDNICKSTLISEHEEKYLEFNYIKKVVRNNSESLYDIKQTINLLESRITKIEKLLDQKDSNCFLENELLSSNVSPVKKKNKIQKSLTISRRKDGKFASQKGKNTQIKTRYQKMREEYKLKNSN